MKNNTKVCIACYYTLMTNFCNCIHKFARICVRFCNTNKCELVNTKSFVFHFHNVCLQKQRVCADLLL